MTNSKYSDRLNHNDPDHDERQSEQAERDASAEVIHQHVTEIWGYVRNHADSLDADKHCQHITEVVTRLVNHMQRRIETLTAEQNRDRKKIATRERQLRDVKSKDKPVKIVKPKAVKGSNLASYVKTMRHQSQPPLAVEQDKPPRLIHKDIL